MSRQKHGLPWRNAITNRPRLAPGVVKSAARVLEILEFFDDIQREATVVEVSQSLDYPQSSTSALMRSLVVLGYLTYDRQTRTFVPSSRVALLGSWTNPLFLREGKLLEVMRELNESTGDAVLLATRNGLYAQYIHVIQATSPARLHITLGTVRPLAASVFGYALLSTMPDAEIARIVTRTNAEANSPDKAVKIRELQPILNDIRTKGYAFMTNVVTKGGGVLAVPLPQGTNQGDLVVGIAGIAEVMSARRDELVRVVLETVNRHVGKPPLRKTK